MSGRKIKAAKKTDDETVERRKPVNFSVPRATANKPAALYQSHVHAREAHYHPLRDARVRQVIEAFLGGTKLVISPGALAAITQIAQNHGLRIAHRAAQLRRGIGVQRQVSLDCVEEAARECHHGELFFPRVLLPLADRSKVKAGKEKK